LRSKTVAIQDRLRSKIFAVDAAASFNNSFVKTRNSRALDLWSVERRLSTRACCLTS